MICGSSHPVPTSTIPSSSIPSSTIPSSTIPSSTIPSSTIPSSTIPSEGAPGRPGPSPATTAPQPWVEAEPFRALLRHLLAVSRLPLAQLAVKIGVPLPLCRRLLNDPGGTTAGHRPARPLSRIPADLAEQLLRTDATGLCAELDVILSAHHAQATLQTLLAEGQPLASLSQVTGLSPEALLALAAGTVRSCTGRVDVAVRAARTWAETHPAAPRSVPLPGRSDRQRPRVRMVA